jgi:hypothetical protein
MKKLLFIFLSFILLASCEKATNTPQLAIGDFHAGGVIFYLDGNGRGLVAAIEDQGRAEWDCKDLYVPRKRGGFLQPRPEDKTWDSWSMEFSGIQNTDRLLAMSDKRPIAASLARDYRGGGYSDWHLPSNEAMSRICANKDLINSTAVKHGGHNFTYNQLYWSSTPIFNWTIAQGPDPDDFIAVALGWDAWISRDSILYVRAVRDFDY